MHRLMSFLKNILYHTPFMNGLPDTRLYDHRIALDETFTTFFFATIPFWGGALLAASIGSSGSTAEGFWATYKDFLWNATKDGILIVVCATLLAPVFHTAIKGYRKGARPFPSKKSFILCVIIIIFLSGGYITADLINYPVNENATKSVTLTISLITLSVTYLATAYKFSIENANSPEFEYGSVIKSETDDLQDQLRGMMEMHND